MIFLIASDFYFHKRVLSRGMMSPALVLVSCVGKHAVLRVDVLALKVGPLIFHSVGGRGKT